MSTETKKGSGGHLFVINGFYMQMRDTFVQPGNAIHYYCIEWDSKAMSWADFRGSFIGVTNPELGALGSLRKTLFDGYEEFKLETKPSKGDNGYHGSASPFEALAERLNWLDSKLDDDDFGKALLAAGVDEDTIMAWTKDPQVDVEGKKASLFDSFEDLDATECLAKAQSIAGVASLVPPTFSKNMAFVFIKPLALCNGTKGLFEAKCNADGVTITSQGLIKAEVIDEKKYIDNHYYSIASKASINKPADLNVPSEGLAKFETKWGVSWKSALDDNLVFNSLDVCKDLGIDGTRLNGMWENARASKDVVKFGGGFCCGKIVMSGVLDRKRSFEGDIKMVTEVTQMGGKKVCEKCQKPIAETGVKTQGKFYHNDCWACSKCNVSFHSMPPGAQSYVLRQGKAMCTACVDSEKEDVDWLMKAPGQLCIMCDGVFRDSKGEPIIAVNLMAGLHHKKCLKCVNTKCKRPIDFTGPKQKFLETSKGVWHNECVMCTTCGKLIDVRMDDHREESNGIYHKNCPSKKHGPPCPHCTKPVIGEYVEFGEVLFHSHCNECQNCQKDLTDCGAIMKKKLLYCGKKCWRKKMMAK